MSLQARYTIRRKIADGGTAEIFLATQQGPHGFEKRVVLKRIFTAFYADPQFRNMLVDEAHIAMSLNHSNIVQVLDLGENEGQYFLALELVDGWTLDTVLRRVQALGAAIPPPIALYLAAEVCRALAYAHGKAGSDGKPLGIVHRDISPHNVLLSEQGEVKITDFGIAKSHNRREKSLGNLIKGKIAFMSPEQASGEPLDRRSDLFSLGTILYVMITRRYPFDAPTDYETLLLVKSGQYPPPEEVRAGLNPELYRVLKRAMSRDREERYQHAEDMLVDVEQVMRLAFRAVGQTELMRWLADLTARDGVLPLTKQGDGASGAIPANPHQSVVQSAASVGFAPGRRAPPPPIPLAARSIRKAPEPTLVDEPVPVVGAAPRENLKNIRTEDLTLEPLLEDAPSATPLRRASLDAEPTTVMAVAGPEAHETRTPPPLVETPAGKAARAPRAGVAREPSPAAPSVPAQPARAPDEPVPVLTTPRFPRPAVLFAGLAVLVLIAGALAFVRHRRTSSETAQITTPTPSQTGAGTEESKGTTPVAPPSPASPGLPAVSDSPVADASTGVPSQAPAQTAGTAAAHEPSSDAGQAKATETAKLATEDENDSGGEGASESASARDDEAPDGEATAVVTVKTTPMGAAVRLGKKNRGATPVNLKLKKGQSYELFFTKEGYSPLTKKVKIGRGATQRFNLALHKLPPPPVAAPAKKPDDAPAKGAKKSWWQVWR
jgi:serine/threonine-protein kinase